MGILGVRLKAELKDLSVIKTFKKQYKKENEGEELSERLGNQRINFNKTKKGNLIKKIENALAEKKDEEEKKLKEKEDKIKAKKSMENHRMKRNKKLRGH